MNLSDLQVITDPYRMLVFDNVFPPSLVRAAYNNWPGLFWDNWHVQRYEDLIRYIAKDGRNGPAACIKLLDKLSEFPVEEYVGPLGIAQEEFFPDMTYQDGGLASMWSGGVMKCHKEELQHRQQEWSKAVKLSFCITPHWDDKFGGKLNLHGVDQIMVKSFSSKFNRLFVHVPSETSFQSISPVVSPIPRCSLTAFFWKYSLCQTG